MLGQILCFYFYEDDLWRPGEQEKNKKKINLEVLLK